MDLEFEEESLETIVTAIKGIDNLNFALFAFLYWGFIYAAFGLFADNLSNAVIASLIISIIGICSLINIVIDYVEYSVFKSHSRSRNLKKILIILTLSLLIFIDLQGLIPSGVILGPLDFLTNYLFFAILLIPLSEGALDIITVDNKNRMQNFIALKLDSKCEKKLTYAMISVMVTIIFSVAYFTIPESNDFFQNNVNLIVIFISIPVLLYFIITRFQTSTISDSFVKENKNILQANSGDCHINRLDDQISKPGDVNLVNLSELLLHMGALIVLVIFLYRAWLIHNKIENGETIEILTISLVVITTILYSANKIKKMEFARPEIISDYYFGMLALAFGGVVFAILYNLKTSMGFLTMDVAMTYFYVVQSIAIAIALVFSVARKINRHLSKGSNMTKVEIML